METVSARATGGACEHHVPEMSVERANVSEYADRKNRSETVLRRGRPPALGTDLVDRIGTVIGGLPACGYRRVHAILRVRLGRAH